MMEKGDMHHQNVGEVLRQDAEDEQSDDDGKDFLLEEADGVENETKAGILQEQKQPQNSVELNMILKQQI